LKSSAGPDAGASPALVLSPRVYGAAEQTATYASLKPVQNPRFGFTAEGSAEDPFAAAVNRAMITARDDPFFYAAITGNPEGELTVVGMNGSIPVLGPPGPRFSARSDKEILRMLQSGVGGSFKNFFAHVFGGTSLDAGEVDDTASNSDENPFRRARESMTETTASTTTGDTDTTKETKTETQTTDAKQTTNGTDTQPPPVEATGPGGGTPSRASLMLRVEQDGTLESVRVSSPSDGVFESAELGMQDFNVLPFRDPAELPTSVTVADFNGDGIPDAAVHVAMQGTLRFFLGQEDGTYRERLQVEIGRGARALAAADFNGDGYTDIAISPYGTGMLTVLYGEPSGDHFRYEAKWSDIYRDYLLAALSGNGRTQLLGMSFDNRGIVLSDFADGTLSGTPFGYVPSLNSQITTATGWSSRINAVVMNSSLALNVDNRQSLITNVVSVAPGTNVYLLVGDVGSTGNMTVGIATPRHP
jgi:hypothetical protein